MKNLINFLKAVWKYMTTAGAWILFLFAISVSFLVFSGVMLLVESHQWIVIVLDATCVMLLTVAIKTRLDRKFDKGGKLLFWSLFSNIALLFIASFGAIWNFLIMLFLLWPMAIGLSRLSFKKKAISFNAKSRQIKRDPVTIFMWEHSSWGDSISWYDWDKRRVCGHMTPLPMEGDVLVAKMESGLIAHFDFIKIDAMENPRDQFFATVSEGEYEKSGRREGSLGFPRLFFVCENIYASLDQLFSLQKRFTRTYFYHCLKVGKRLDNFNV